MKTVLLCFAVLLFIACPEPPARPAFLQPNVEEKESIPTPESSSTVGPQEESSAPVSQDAPMTTNPLPPETPVEGTGPTVGTVTEEEVIDVEDVVTESPAVSEIAEVPPKEEPKIVINELYYDAVGSDTNGVLFIELYGTPSSALAGFQINLVNGDDGKVYQTLTLPDGAVTGADGYFLIADAKTGSTSESFVTGSDWIANFDPQNGPDALQLLNAEGEFLDALGYGMLALTTTGNTYPLFEGSTAPDVGNGHSLERKGPGVDTDSNLADFVDQEVPTPGF